MAKATPPLQTTVPGGQSRSGSPGLLALLAFTIIPAVAAGLIALQTAPPPAPPSYRAEATLLVNRFSPGVLASSADRDGTFVEEQFLPHPQALTRLVTTPDVVNRARIRYESRTGKKAPELASLLSGVSAVNEVLADTAVRREVSPAIQVAFSGADRAFVLEFLRDWLRASVEHSGSLLVREVTRRRNNLGTALDGLGAELTGINELLASARARRSILLSEWGILAGGADSPGLPEPLTSGQKPTNDTPAPSTGAGSLMGQLAARSLHLRLQSASTASPWTASDIARERATVDAVYADAQSSASRIQISIAKLQTLVSAAETSATNLQIRIASLTQAQSRFETYAEAAGSSAFAGSADDYPSGPELRVVSAPVLAFERSSARPPAFWALVAAGVAGAMGLLLGLGLRRQSPYSG